MTITTRVLEGFEDPSFGREEWNELLRGGASDVVFLTWEWQRAWWESFRRQQLLLLTAERSGHVVAVAPLFAEDGVVYFVGSGGSDYLDFIGDVGDPDVLDALLRAARDAVTDWAGFCFYHVPEGSPTGRALERSAPRLGLTRVLDGELPAPALDLTARAVAERAANKQSLVRHERLLRRHGVLEVQHLRDGEAILDQLDAFFEQHVARWQATPHPSLFRDPRRRAFYRCVARLAAKTDWLRFTRLDWNGRPVAFHFGFCYRGRYLWYKPSFAIEHARQSPGEVLLRQLLLAAIEEEGTTFDFGIGDEAFKRRFATHVTRVRSWRLVPATGNPSP